MSGASDAIATDAACQVQGVKKISKASKGPKKVQTPEGDSWVKERGTKLRSRYSHLPVILHTAPEASLTGGWIGKGARLA